jgi:hypothetical protein
MPPAPPPERPQEPATSRSKVVKRDIHALLVAADLLEQGFAVFHKLGRASPCDFVIVRGRRCWRVAVRTVYSISPTVRSFRDGPLTPNALTRWHTYCPMA